MKWCCSHMHAHKLSKKLPTKCMSKAFLRKKWIGGHLLLPIVCPNQKSNILGASMQIWFIICGTNKVMQMNLHSKRRWIFQYWDLIVVATFWAKIYDPSSILTMIEKLDWKFIMLFRRTWSWTGFSSQLLDETSNLASLEHQVLSIQDLYVFHEFLYSLESIFGLSYFWIFTKLNKKLGAVICAYEVIFLYSWN